MVRVRVLQKRIRHLLAPIFLSWLFAAMVSASDSVVVFNEIMYHPASEESRMEWIELHNQLVVDVDLSGWSVTGGIDYVFPTGAVISAGGYLVVAVSPEDLALVTGLTDVNGPFVGRLSNSGESLRLRNNSNRIMDEIEYADGGHWPVAPDGSGVSLAKIDPDQAGPSPENWTWSRQVGGTPGKINFPSKTGTIQQTNLIQTFDTWRFHDQGQDLGTAWREPGYDDSAWNAQPAGFYVGTTATSGERIDIPTLYSTGLGDDREPLTPGQDDPHYTNSATGEPVLAMQNHSAWLSNDAQSQWVGLTGQGTDNVPGGQYTFVTTFDLSGMNHTTANLTLSISVDNWLDDVRINGTSTGISAAGFSGWNGPYAIETGFVEGINQLEFIFTNEGSDPNPAGLRIRINGTAVAVPGQTELSSGANTYYFRKPFWFQPDPTAHTSLELDALIDDGAVFYLNGQKVHAINMPGGTVDYHTTALNDIIEITPTGRIALSGEALVSGENLLAVGVHQASGSDDMFFAAGLVAVETPLPDYVPPEIALNELDAAFTFPFLIELYNYGNESVDLTGMTLACQGTTTGQYDLPSQMLSPGDYLVLNEVVLGFHPTDEDKLFLYAPEQYAVIDAAVVKNSRRARFPEGTGAWAYPYEATFGSTNRFLFHDEIVINEIMYHDRPVPESEAEYETTYFIMSNAVAATLVPEDDSLNLDWTGGNDLFDDSAWTQGQGNTTGVGYETSAADFQGLIGTDILDEMYQTNASVYIRVPFEVSNPESVESLILRMKYDDGFVAYLNGQEVEHVNAPGRDGNTDPLVWDSHATASHADSEAVVFESFDITQYKTFLKPGINILAIHGLNWSTGSTDMLIFPELYARREIHPYIPFHESPQEWVELYNRSDHSVDLTGWKLDGGIEYEFTPGTMIESGRYLVVAADADILRSMVPDIAIVGNFNGGLSDREDVILLQDANKNIADEVHYYDRGYWPQYADAGGCSLELCDSSADNAFASAWASSNETQKSSWRSYSYRAIASPTSGGNEPSQWNEFIFGLLDAGEFLIDDIRVVEDPDGTAVQVLQNSSFEGGLNAWRLLGNHAFGQVVPDPVNPYNQVLHVCATGPSEHMHNHIETTLASGRTIVNGKEYQISFRAKWLGGSNLLNTRLYFNRAAKTTALTVPSSVGTPGRQNSRYQTNMGPTMSGLIHAPAVPDPSSPVTISVCADDPDGIQTVSLLWSQDEQAFQSISMHLNAAGRYEAEIGPFSAATVVQFYIQATDSLGAVTCWPSGGPDSRALFKVNDGLARSGGAHNFRILMTASDAVFLHEPTNVMSNHRMGATVIYNERDIYYDVGLHLKGSGYGRNNNRVGFNIRFRPDQLFHGVHDTVSIDRNGGPGGVGASHRELVLKHIGNRAGGIPGMYDDIVYLLSPWGNVDGPAQLMMARYDDAFLDAQYADGGEGSLYEFELIYHSGNTVDGNPESLKLPPNGVLAVDLRDMGDDKEGYRWNYLIKNNRAADDFTQIIYTAKTFGKSGSELEENINSVIDVDQWMRVFAFESLGGVGDTYNQGLAHNLMFYIRPEDQRALAMPWDLDFAFFQSTTSSIFGYGSNLQKVIALDPYKRSFYGHLYDIMKTSFNTEYLSDWVSRYATASGQDVSSEILSRVQQRQDYVLGQLPAEIPFVITTNAGNPLTVVTDYVTIRGNGWINVYQIRLSGNTEPLDVQWTDLDSWQVTVPLEFGENVLLFEAYDFQGNLLASDTLAVTSVSDTHPLRKSLRVTELMADPLGGKEYEFIELQNTGSESLDLTDVTITGGIQFTFADSAVTTLEPGQFVVAVEDIDAFQSRYGTDLLLAGQFTGALDNDGESLYIRGRFNSDILSFEYGDSRCWPLAALGGGHSMVPAEEAISNQPEGSLYYGRNWRASTRIYGSPGKSDPTPPSGIVLNEIMAHTDYYISPYESNDWIELYNASDLSIQLDNHWYLSDDLGELKKWSLPNIVVEPHSFLSFDEVSGFHNPITSGFGLNKAGDEVILSCLPGTEEDRIVDCIRFKSQENNISLGRFPDGGIYWQAMPATRDWPNSQLPAHLIISEVMFKSNMPEIGHNYIELYNPTNEPIELDNEAGSWRLDGAVSFTFSPDTVIPPYSRLLLVDFQPTNDLDLLETFQIEYATGPLTSGIDIVGPWNGQLSDPTGRIAIEKPQAPDILGESVSWIIIDEVFYFDNFPWPITDGNPGHVLQRQPGLSSGNDPASWRVSTPSPGFPSPAPADLDQNTVVDWNDFAAFGTGWLSESGDLDWNPSYDLAVPPDGIIDMRDIRVLIDYWLWHTRKIP
ncbi:MAG: lamin tail domain-containing protein [Sedimentisphaerales bacterium]|nr:lamin tail domain-containing protein [Sedimentisphaerales bacterium]